MKKVFLCLVSLALAVTLFGCSADGKHVDGTLTELMAKVYAGADAQFPMLVNIPVTPDNFAYHFGTDNAKYTEALVSEAAIGSIPHSVTLIRVSPNENIKSLKDRIKKSDVGRKWICVGIDKGEVIVDNIGDLVIIIIEKDTAARKALHDSFKALAKE